TAHDELVWQRLDFDPTRWWGWGWGWRRRRWWWIGTARATVRAGARCDQQHDHAGTGEWDGAPAHDGNLRQGAGPGWGLVLSIGFPAAVGSRPCGCRASCPVAGEVVRGRPRVDSVVDAVELLRVTHHFEAVAPALQACRQRPVDP